MNVLATFEKRYKPGVKSGLLTFLRLSTRRGDNNRIFAFFACDCGNEIELPAGRVIRGKRTHCGCLANRTPNLRHGMRRTPEYNSWIAMKRRCLDQTDKDYPRYGGRGITVYAAWKSSFELFYRYVGARPHGTTLDRIDNKRGYEPGNVRWAPPVIQQTNRRDSWRAEINGIVYESLQEAADAYGVALKTIVCWYDGYIDKRRLHHKNGGKISSKPGCRRWRKYE